MAEPTFFSGEQLKAKMEAARDSRSERNGFTEAMEIITFTLPKAFAQKGRGGRTMDEVRESIFNEIFNPMLADDDFSESVLDDAVRDAFEKGRIINLVEKVVAYCAFAVRCFFQEDEGRSWSYAADAKYWAGVVMVAVERGATLPSPGQALASLRHLETKRKRESVASYWRENIDPKLSAQKAADKVVRAEISGLSHKVIAEIISALRREEVMRKA